MNGITDEMLMAYVDGELPAEQAAALERAAAAPDVARRIEAHRRSRAATRDAFAGLLAAAPPERLLAAVLPAPRPAERRPWRSRAALPLAASLALVVGIGGYWAGQLTRTAPESLAAATASAGFMAALGTQASGAALDVGTARLTLTGTYPVADGLCRTFVLARPGEAMRGIGCDHGNGWRTELLVADQAADAGAAPASGRAAELVDDYLEGAGAGAALAPSEEAQRLGRR